MPIAEFTCRLRDVHNGNQKLGLSLHFLAEGAANAVFAVREVDSADIALEQKDAKASLDCYVGFEDNSGNGRTINFPDGAVIRVPKTNPKTPKAKEIKRDFDKYIKPLFPEELQGYLVEHDLVGLSYSVLAVLYHLLKGQENRKHKGDIFVNPNNDHALLMRDMSSVRGKSLCIEFKPKWLYPDPAEPLDSTRCRTCAMRAYRNSQPGSHKKKTYICPLELAYGDPEKLKPFLQGCIDDEIERSGLRIDLPSQDYILDAMLRSLTKGLAHALILCLKKLQMAHDPRDLKTRLDEETTELNKRIAMTLRDCSMFMRVDYTRYPLVGIAEVMLADLDLKDAEKLPDWETKSLILKQEGWFAGREEEGTTLVELETCGMARRIFRKGSFQKED
ncbi:hypothetical protein GQ43DRAFT_81818 [Delitschia confertaspora ATCC 74209]|uniref:Inositol-pentakisphosphate 2-kinase n=1 Tax=Delitschia confertaspora ATCC 74209 TaxID=1513339 RepID=A0A9P4MRS3_9PLEO|nr:hypothetical protein GQ43DRAFT_81818 [Delitschia confertaspora ATCC 74209]